MSSCRIEDLMVVSTDFDEEISLRDYFKTLLKALWCQGDDFSGKRPFGNSAWQYDLYTCLIKNELINGKLDEFGFIEEFDEKAGNSLILNLIETL